jgi:predicted nucleic acid-binding protein
MEQLSRALADHRILGLDTPVFIYHLEANQTYLRLTKEIFSSMQEGRWQAVTSTITLLEVTVPAWRQSQESIARQYETLLINFPNLMVLDINREVARLAAQLRAVYHLRTPDALQVAASQIGGATVLITNDRNLKRLEKAIDVVILSDYC